MLPYLKEFWGYSIFAVLGIAMAAMADLILPKLLARIISAVGTDAGNGLVLQIGLRMLLVTLLSLVGAIFGNYFAAKLSAGFSRKMRMQVFARVQDYSLAEMNIIGPSSLITRNTNDIQQIQQFISMFVRIFVRSPILLVGGSIMASTENPRLARPLLFSIPLIILAIFLVSRFIIPLFLQIQQKIDSVNRVLREQITGIRVVRAFGNEAHETERFDAINKDYSATSLKMLRSVALLNPLLTIIMNITVVFILLLSMGDANSGRLVVEGTSVAVIQYVMQIMFSLILMSMIFILYPRAVASAERIAEVLDQKLSITDLKEPQQIPPDKKGQIEFRNVSFTFPNAERPVVENLSFIANKGDRVAIIGSTGSGKSTILRLIMRFYDVTQGRILVDDVDIRELAQHDLRARMGYISQKSQLFSGTISENIRLGKENATQEEMVEAAEIAQALEFIQNENGEFEAHVAQGGINYSGGQKQRLSITRAMVRKPEFLLFDDSFSALDAATDLKLRTELKEKAAGITQIVVAQRIASIADSDLILVLDNGCVVGKGTHNELLEHCKVYQEIAKSQFLNEEVQQ